MEFTQYPQINELLVQTENKIKTTLGKNLTGLYLYGSATAGDFDPELSDIDLVTVTKENISDEEFEKLNKMHNQFALEQEDWKDRIEVVYISQDDLKNFRDKQIKIAEISPGEPFHFKEIGNEWLINWYVIRQNGVSVFGPDPKTIIPEISVDEYKKAIQEKVLLWKEALNEYTPESTRGSVAYAILSLCRSLYSHEKGEQASKKKSAEWAAEKFSEWKDLITKAMEWRKLQWKDNQKVGNELPNAINFLKFAIEKITYTS